jgi:DNA polymerase III subunit beta
MKINLKSLLQVLEVNSKCLGGNKVIPAYDEIKFEIVKGRCEIVTNNGHVQIKSFLQLSEDVNESFTVYGKTFIDTLKLIDAEEIEIILKDKSLTLKAGKSKYSLPIGDGKMFPVLSSETTNFNTFPATICKEIPKASQFAAPNDIRVAITGISLRSVGEETHIQGADGHILYNSPIESKIDNDVIIQYSAASMLSIFANESNVKVGTSVKNTVFKSDSTELTIVNIDGIFPKLDQFITRGESKIKVNRVQLIKSIKRISLYSNTTSKFIKLSINGNELKLESMDVDFSKEAVEYIDVISIGLDSIEIGFNYVKLLTGINVIESEDIFLEITEPSRPCKIYSDFDNSIAIVMPVFIQ